MKTRKMMVVVLAMFLFVRCGGDSVTSENAAMREARLARTAKTVEVVNNNSNFGEYPLLKPSSEPSSRYYYGYEEIFSLWDENGDALTGVYGIAVEGIWCVSQIIILRDPYHVYGVHIGDPLENAQELLLAQGFQVKGSHESGVGLELNDVHIDLYADENSELYQIVLTVFDPYRPEIDGAY